MLARIPRKWLGVGAVLASLALGCGQTRQAKTASPCHGCSGAGVALASTGPASAHVASAPTPAGPSPLAATPPLSGERYTPPDRPPQALPHDVASPFASVTRPDAPEQRRYPDAGARAGLGRAPDYSWLTGELQYLQAKKVWRLRYASIDEEDRYGGSVTLHGAAHMIGDQIKPGMTVRIEGSLLNPDAREPSPGYRVRDIQLAK